MPRRPRLRKKKRCADIVGRRAGDDDRHGAGFFEKGQSVSHGARGLRAAIPGNDHGRDRFFAGVWRRIRRGDHDRTGAVVDGGLDRRRGDVIGVRAGPADQQDAGEAPQGDELVARDVFAAGEGRAGDRGNQLAKGPFGLRGARLQPAVGQGLQKRHGLGRDIDIVGAALGEMDGIHRPVEHRGDAGRQTERHHRIRPALGNR